MAATFSTSRNCNLASQPVRTQATPAPAVVQDLLVVCLSQADAQTQSPTCSTAVTTPASSITPLSLIRIQIPSRNFAFLRTTTPPNTDAMVAASSQLSQKRAHTIFTAACSSSTETPH